MRDVQGATGAIDSAGVRLGMVLLALSIGFLVGLAVFCLMNVSTWLTGLLWEGVGGAMGAGWFPVAACTLGGLAIGLWTWWSNDRVRSLEEVMGEFRRTGSYRTNGAIRPVVSFLLPLVFGGSVGFEAGLTGIITAACCWVRDRLKAAGLRAATIADVTIAASVSAIFGAPLAGVVAGVEGAAGAGVDDFDLRRGAKAVLYTAAAVGALGGIAASSALFGTTGGLPRFEAISATRADLLWVVPCLGAAYALTLVHHGASRAFGVAARRMGVGDSGSGVGTVLAPVVCGLAMGLVACVLPLVLFPGEAQSEELMTTWTTLPALALLATSLLKAAITPMCLKMGWMGGSLFPSIFSGVACGFGLAALTGADPMLMVTVTTAAFLAGVTRKPLLSLAILTMCFPLSGILWSGLAAVVGAALPVPATWLDERE